MRVLLDSGVTKNGNIGDKALLDVTMNRFSQHNLSWVSADKLNVLRALIGCQVYVFCSGGLLKNQEPVLLARKLFAVALARLMRKKVIVDTQTVFLTGLWRILFKMIFRGMVVQCRDSISLRIVQRLGLKARLKRELLLKHPGKKQRLKRYIAVDTRYRYYNAEARQIVERLLEKYKGFKIVYIPTMHTAENWRKIAKLFKEAQFSICASYHAVVFSVNGGHSAFFVVDAFWGDYYKVKLRGLRKC